MKLMIAMCVQKQRKDIQFRNSCGEGKRKSFFFVTGKRDPISSYSSFFLVKVVWGSLTWSKKSP